MASPSQGGYETRELFLSLFFPFKLRQFKDNPNENHQAVLNIVIPFLPHSHPGDNYIGTVISRDAFAFLFFFSFLFPSSTRFVTYAENLITSGH